MRALEKEIRKYNILGFCQVRKEGSIHGEHPNRALWDICGKPCFQWVLEAVKGCHYINKIAVVTDSREIKELLYKIGGVVVVDRPLASSLNMPRDYTKGMFKRTKPRSLLCRDSLVYSGTMGLADFHLEQEEGYIADIWVNIGANEPMVTTEIFNRLIEKFFEDEEAGRVITVHRFHEYLHIINPTTGRIYPVMNLGGMDRQEWPEMFSEGAPTITGMPSICTTQPLTGKTAYIEALPEEMVDMHNGDDLFLARVYMARRLEREKISKGGRGIQISKKA